MSERAWILSEKSLVVSEKIWVVSEKILDVSEKIWMNWLIFDNFGYFLFIFVHFGLICVTRAFYFAYSLLTWLLLGYFDLVL